MCRLITGAPGSDGVSNMPTMKLNLGIIAHGGGEAEDFRRGRRGEDRSLAFGVWKGGKTEGEGQGGC